MWHATASNMVLMLKHHTLLLLLLATGLAQASGEFYCCQDPHSGRRVCADTLPEQCRGRAHRILDSGGNVIKEVEAPLSAAQRAERAHQETLQKQADDARREQRRKDQALLETYATLEDINLSERKNESDVKLAIQSAQSKIEAELRKRKKLEDEAEFYKKRSLPPDLAKALRAVDHEIKVTQELLDVKKNEFAMIHAKYEADRKRFIELTGDRRHATPPGGAAAR